MKTRDTRYADDSYRREHHEYGKAWHAEVELDPQSGEIAYIHNYYPHGGELVIITNNVRTTEHTEQRAPLPRSLS